MVAVGATETLPLVPDAVKPDPVQEDAFADDHESFDDCPLLIDVGDAVSVTVGAGFWDCVETATLALALVFPPVPVQEIE